MLKPTVPVGTIRWTTREVDAAIPPNLKQVAPQAMTNPKFVEQPKK